MEDGRKEVMLYYISNMCKRVCCKIEIEKGREGGINKLKVIKFIIGWNKINWDLTLK